MTIWIAAFSWILVLPLTRRQQHVKLSLPLLFISHLSMIPVLDLPPTLPPLLHPRLPHLFSLQTQGRQTICGRITKHALPTHPSPPNMSHSPMTPTLQWWVLGPLRSYWTAILLAYGTSSTFLVSESHCTPSGRITTISISAVIPQRKAASPVFSSVHRPKFYFF